MKGFRRGFRWGLRCGFDRLHALPSRAMFQSSWSASSSVAGASRAR